MTDLSSFLREQQSGLLDSSGVFTIAADKALSKLAHSQLPDPSFWILKVVQFAVALEVMELDVQVSARTSRLAMELPRPVFLADLRHGLDSVAPLGDRAMDHLVTGLRALGGSSDRRFALRLASLDHSEYLYFDGEGLSSELQETPAPIHALVLEVTTASRNAWTAVVDTLGLQRRAGESQALSERAFTAPFKMTVDGREVGFDEAAPPNWFRQHLFWDFASEGGGMRLPSFLLPSADARASAFWRLSYSYTLDHKAFNLVPDPVDRREPSTLNWLRDGVVVESEHMALRTARSSGVAPSPLTLALFVDAADLPADLGGLALRRSKELAAKRKWLRDLLGYIGELAVQRIDGLNGLPGEALGGWEAVVVSTKYLPISQRLVYDKPTRVAKKLNAHPTFRKKILKRLRGHARDGTVGAELFKLVEPRPEPHRA